MILAVLDLRGTENIQDGGIYESRISGERLELRNVGGVSRGMSCNTRHCMLSQVEERSQE